MNIGYLPLEPKQCNNSDELHLCQWLKRQCLKFKKGELSVSCIERLTAIGMDWLNTDERA